MTVENVKKALDRCGKNLSTIQTTANAIFYSQRIESIEYDGDLVIITDKNGQIFYIDALDINIISTDSTGI